MLSEIAPMVSREMNEVQPLGFDRRHLDPPGTDNQSNFNGQNGQYVSISISMDKFHRFYTLQIQVSTEYVYKSADPGLGQGTGGAWDHRRCGFSVWPFARPLLTVRGCHEPLKPQHSLLAGSQACHLPAFKTPQNSPKPAKTTPTLCSSSNEPLHFHFRAFKRAV